MVSAQHLIPLTHEQQSTGGRLVASDGRELPLKKAALHASARGGIARTTLVQTFVNPHEEPLLVRYLLPLPADGAVSGFSFRIGDSRVVGEIDKKSRARERFEEAVAEGKTAAIIEEERSSLFTQEVGNIAPGEKIECELIVDQPLTWLAEGGWQWRFPTVVGPRYMGATGRVKDAANLNVPIADGDIGLRMQLELSIGDELGNGGKVESSSHALHCESDEHGQRVKFGSSSGARLDKDIVVSWPVAKPEVGLSLMTARPSSENHDGATYGLLTVVPPAPKANKKAVARDLIALIDTSGSMGGQPLNQAKRVVAALIDDMGDEDRLELIEFSSAPRRWQKEPIATTKDGKKSAQKWLRQLSAGGATEMRAGIMEALRPLRDGSQRQVLLITDGYIGFEEEIISEVVHRLPSSSRVHTLGVGSSVNRSLTSAVARAGGGAEFIVGIGEDVERAIGRLSKRMNAPLVTDLRIDGDAVVTTSPARLPDLFAGSPALIAVKLHSRAGTITVSGATANGEFHHEVKVPALVLGAGDQAVAALYGRERVEDLETLQIAGGDIEETNREIEKVGLDFQISTRLTSWVAISDDTTSDVGNVRRVEMPHELPYGTGMEGFGLRSVAPAPEMMMRSMIGGQSRESASLASLAVSGSMDSGPSGQPYQKAKAPSRLIPFLTLLVLLGMIAFLLYLLGVI